MEGWNKCMDDFSKEIMVDVVGKYARLFQQPNTILICDLKQQS